MPRAFMPVTIWMTTPYRLQDFRSKSYQVNLSPLASFKIKTHFLSIDFNFTDPNLNDVRGPTRSSWIQQEDSVTFQAGKSFSLSCIDPNADPNVSWEKPRRADDDDYYKRYNVVRLTVQILSTI